MVKDHRYDYIETGSLLSIKKNVKGILIPSEETRISMYPMDYEEFLWAVNKAPTFELIQYDAVNRELMKDFRLYMLIGGMPQAVNEYLNSNDFSTVDAIKRNILELYMDDFRKIDPTGKASRLFLSIPSELSRNTMRYKIGSIIENATASRLGELLMDMADSMTVNFAYHTNDPSVGLPLHADYDCFKMFLNDTGLFVLLSDKLSTDLGYVYENVIAQILKSSGNELFYYTFKEKVEKVNAEDNPVVRNYEVDFLLSRKDKICPIEVKSSGYNSHKSLDKFQEKYSSRIFIYKRCTQRQRYIMSSCLYGRTLVKY